MHFIIEILKKKPIHLNYTSELLFDSSILKIRLETNHDRFVIVLSIVPYFLSFEQFLLTSGAKNPVEVDRLAFFVTVRQLNVQNEYYMKY